MAKKKVKKKARFRVSPEQSPGVFRGSSRGSLFYPPGMEYTLPDRASPKNPDGSYAFEPVSAKAIPLNEEAVAMLEATEARRQANYRDAPKALDPAQPKKLKSIPHVEEDDDVYEEEIDDGMTVRELGDRAGVPNLEKPAKPSKGAAKSGSVRAADK